VTDGTATLQVNGGELYVGSGGIVAGDGTAPRVVELSSGTLGAQADWSSTLPITLPASGHINVRAADAAGAGFDIALGGPLAGAGGFVKSGAGRLVLAGANTFTGAVAVNAGDLAVQGSIGPGADIAVNNGGVLSGSGTVARAVVLNAGG